MSSLLPYNSTKFERDLEAAIKYVADPSALSGFKFKIIGSSVTLAWEYSLAQVNIDDFAERILKGLKFHRLRGTPESLRNALSWYGFTDIVIEEEIPGEHFAEFQLGITEIHNGFVPDPIISVSAFAAPLRSRLSRMYNNLYDERCLFFDDSLLDEGVLSDDLPESEYRQHIDTIVSIWGGDAGAITPETIQHSQFCFEVLMKIALDLEESGSGKLYQSF
jgi:P2-related tail formation protein